MASVWWKGLLIALVLNLVKSDDQDLAGINLIIDKSGWTEENFLNELENNKLDNSRIRSFLQTTSDIFDDQKLKALFLSRQNSEFWTIFNLHNNMTTTKLRTILQFLNSAKLKRTVMHLDSSESRTKTPIIGTELKIIKRLMIYFHRHGNQWRLTNTIPVRFFHGNNSQSHGDLLNYIKSVQPFVDGLRVLSPNQQELDVLKSVLDEIKDEPLELEIVVDPLADNSFVLKLLDEKNFHKIKVDYIMTSKTSIPAVYKNIKKLLNIPEEPEVKEEILKVVQEDSPTTPLETTQETTTTTISPETTTAIPTESTFFTEATTLTVPKTNDITPLERQKRVAPLMDSGRSSLFTNLRDNEVVPRQNRLKNLFEKLRAKNPLIFQPNHQRKNLANIFQNLIAKKPENQKKSVETSNLHSTRKVVEKEIITHKKSSSLSSKSIEKESKPESAKKDHRRHFEYDFSGETESFSSERRSVEVKNPRKKRKEIKKPLIPSLRQIPETKSPKKSSKKKHSRVEKIVSSSDSLEAYEDSYESLDIDSRFMAQEQQFEDSRLMEDLHKLIEMQKKLKNGGKYKRSISKKRAKENLFHELTDHYPTAIEHAKALHPQESDKVIDKSENNIEDHLKRKRKGSHRRKKRSLSQEHSLLTNEVRAPKALIIVNTETADKKSNFFHSFVNLFSEIGRNIQKIFS